MGGKLQLKRGVTVPAQLAAGEPFFDGEDLHVGKLGGTGGNKKIGGGSSGALVTWETGDTKPTVAATRVCGDFIEGRTHMVNTYTLPNNETAAVITVQRENGGFTSFESMISGGYVAKSGNMYVQNDLTIMKMPATGGGFYEHFQLSESMEYWILDKEDESIFEFRNVEGTIVVYKYASSGIEDSTFQAFTIFENTEYSYIYGDFLYLMGKDGVANKKIQRYNKTTGAADAVFNANAPVSPSLYKLHVDGSGVYTFEWSDVYPVLLRFDITTGLVDTAFNSAVGNTHFAHDVLFIGDYDGYLYLEGISEMEGGNTSAFLKISELSGSITGIVEELEISTMGRTPPMLVAGKLFFIHTGAPLSILDLTTNVVTDFPINSLRLELFVAFEGGIYITDNYNNALTVIFRKYDFLGNEITVEKDYVLEAILRENTVQQISSGLTIDGISKHYFVNALEEPVEIGYAINVPYGIYYIYGRGGVSIFCTIYSLTTIDLAGAFMAILYSDGKAVVPMYYSNLQYTGNEAQ